jgi:hypothetical protein
MQVCSLSRGGSYLNLHAKTGWGGAYYRFKLSSHGLLLGPPEIGHYPVFAVRIEPACLRTSASSFPDQRLLVGGLWTLLKELQKT